MTMAETRGMNRKRAEPGRERMDRSNHPEKEMLRSVVLRSVVGR